MISKNKENIVLGIYGVNGVGKTVVSQKLLAEIKIGELQSTDNLLPIFRLNNPDEKWSAICSYTAWQMINDRNQANIIAGFRKYRGQLRGYIKSLIDRACADQFSLIIEGIHFEADLNRTKKIKVIPVLLKIGDRTKHQKRISEKSAGRTDLKNKLKDNFAAIRTIQDFLIKEARSANCLIIDTGRIKAGDVIIKIIDYVQNI